MLVNHGVLCRMTRALRACPLKKREFPRGTVNNFTIQSVRPKIVEVRVNDSIRKAYKLAVALSDKPPLTSWGAIVHRLSTLISFSLALLWPFGLPKYTGYYDAYTPKFSGQFWAAACQKEFSIYKKVFEKSLLPVAHRDDCTVSTYYPRLLMLYNTTLGYWMRCSDQNILKYQSYVAISYRQSDFFAQGESERLEKEALVDTIQRACLSEGYHAYWLDFQCTGISEQEINLDLYRIADVFRGASFTLIMIKETNDAYTNKGWKSWGSRIWTLPEALLSPQLRYKVGTGAGPVHRVTLRQVANWAYEHHDKEVAVINAYGGNDQLGRIERLALLRGAIWRRSSGSTSQPSIKKGPSSGFTSYPAEKVYALMGFFDRRIEPNRSETELQALARLFMANDNDRFLARMVSLLPPVISPTSCWYSCEDVYEAKLWEVEPRTQVSGITKTGALVLGGCRVALIRWSGFPEVALQFETSIKRFTCRVLPYLFWEILLLGLGLLPAWRTLGVSAICTSLSLLFISPRLLVYGHSGHVERVQPWLIGVKGVIKAEEVSQRIYGGRKSSPVRFSYSPSGSPLAIPEEGNVRQGDKLQAYLASMSDKDVYTLIDTVSSTIYYFPADRVPTVCVFTGLEGGLGRFVLCSQSDLSDELHKETVLRMPVRVGDMMHTCDQIAIGCLKRPVNCQ